MNEIGSKLEKEFDYTKYFYSDFKKFTADNVTFCVSQITTLNGEEFDLLRESLEEHLEKAYQEQRVDMIILMLTDVMKESSELLFVGNIAKNVIRRAFNVKTNDNSVVLEGMVSRKKQLIPALMMSIQREK